jgi:hypothetical protein
VRTSTVVFLLIVLLSACAPIRMPHPTPTAMYRPPALMSARGQAAIDKALHFLEGQYNPTYGLLQESPNIGAHRYFIANDALLAAYAFELYYHNEDMVRALRDTASRYGEDGNNFIDAAWGEVISWPPLHFEDPGTLIEEHGQDQIMTIKHLGPGYFFDWSGYSNLACMASVNEHNKGNLEVARWLYDIQVATFDGHGWQDIAYYARDGHYETIGLTWCLYAGAILGKYDERILLAMLDQQNPQSGGFHTHYRADAPRLADPNVETTALALLALHVLQIGSAPSQVELVFPKAGPPSP